MAGPGVEQEITALLQQMNERGGYTLALVCTDQGLLIASTGERLLSEATAGLTSLFDDIAVRAARDHGIRGVEEFTVLAGDIGRLVVRPLALDSRPRLFLVTQVPIDRAWRRNTAVVARKVRAILHPLIERDVSL